MFFPEALGLYKLHHHLLSSRLIPVPFGKQSCSALLPLIINQRLELWIIKRLRMEKRTKVVFHRSTDLNPQSKTLKTLSWSADQDIVPVFYPDSFFSRQFICIKCNGLRGLLFKQKILPPFWLKWPSWPLKLLAILCRLQGHI